VDETPAVERDVAFDLVKRGLLVAPVVVLFCGLIRGWDGAISAAIALAIVFLNMLASAAIVTRAARSGPTAIGAAAAGGYVLRLALIVVVLLALRNQPWIDLPVLGFVLVGAQVGLLLWEAKYVSLTLAAPGLRPTRPGPPGDQ
jgi:hypothetical protein